MPDEYVPDEYVVEQRIDPETWRKGFPDPDDPYVKAIRRKKAEWARWWRRTHREWLEPDQGEPEPDP